MPGKQAINKCIRIDDLCMLADEHPELSVPCCVLYIVRPLLLHGDGVPGRLSFVRLLQEQSNEQTFTTQKDYSPIAYSKSLRPLLLR